MIVILSDTTSSLPVLTPVKMLWAVLCLVNLPLALVLQAPSLPEEGVRLFLASENRTLPNHAMVKAAQFRVDDLTPMDGISDAIWCQAAPSLGVVHYQWYGPGGLDDPVNLTTTLSNASEITESTTFIVVEDDQVGLARPRNMGIGDNEGLYQCVITTNETKHTLVVGVYRTGIYDNNTGPVVNSPVQFSLTSPRDADPPQFTLSFNVSNAPATTVNCSVNDEPIENMSVSRDILDSEPPTLTEVTVTIRQRTDGVYNCTVSNARVEDGTITVTGANITASPGLATVTLSVTGTPTNVVLSADTISWTVPPTPVSGYEVFYLTAAGETFSGGNTTDTNFTLCGLSIFVVAYTQPADNSLPSARSDNKPLVDSCVATTVIISSTVDPTTLTAEMTIPTTGMATPTAGMTIPTVLLAVCVVLGLLLILSVLGNIAFICVLIRSKNSSAEYSEVKNCRRDTEKTLDELSCDLYSERNTEYQSVDYAAIEKEAARRSRVSLKVPPYAFTIINTNGSAEITEKPAELSVEECLYDNPDENAVKNKEEDKADSNGQSHRCSTPELDDTYDNPITVERVNNHNKDTPQYSSIDDHEVISIGRADETDQQVTLSAAVELQERQLPYLYTAVDKSIKSTDTDEL